MKMFNDLEFKKTLLELLLFAQAGAEKSGLTDWDREAFIVGSIEAASGYDQYLKETEQKTASKPAPCVDSSA